MGVPAVPSWFPARIARRWARARVRPAVLIRRVLAALLLLTAVVLAVRPMTAPAGPSSPVIVSAHDLTAGSTLRISDVRVAWLPDSLRPTGALSAPEAVDGRLLAGPARAGEPITDVRLVGPPGGLPTTGDPRKSVVPVRLADSGVAALLHAGTRVDVIGGGTLPEGSGALLASMAVVVAVTAPQAHGRAEPGTAGSGSLVLLELPSQVATQVAAVSLGQPVTVTLR